MDVPTVRHFSSLQPIPTASSPAEETATPPNLLLRVLTGIFLLSAICFLGYGGLMAYERLTFPVDLSKTEEDYYSEARKAVENMPPVAAWDTWNVIAYTGLSEIYTPDYFQMKRAFEAAAPYMYTYLTIGTVSLIGFIVSIVLARRK
ncbi:MAG: hypothetical protein MUD03_00915 [Pirellula sp.]|nr:hypothetical protein [Pirellula sp.]